MLPSHSPATRAMHSIGREAPMIRRTFAFAVAAAAALFVFTSSAQAQNVRVGTLDCFSPGSVGFIIGSVTNFNCTFRPAAGGPGERYAGRISRLGLDLGFTTSIRPGRAGFSPRNH